MSTTEQLKREMVKAIYQGWDHYAHKKQMMGSPETSRIAEAILERFHVEPLDAPGLSE